MNSKQLEQLILMINQIVDNNSYNMSEIETIDITHNHVSKFWARSMKSLIINYAQSDGEKLNHLAKKSIALLSTKVPYNND